MDSVTVTARKWEGGWDLIIDDDHATSVRYLHDAGQQVRDYLDTLCPGIDHTSVHVEVRPEIGELGEAIAQARAATRAAAEAQENAARRAREVARRIRSEGYSVDDTADLIGVSRGRVSQLLKSANGA